MYLINLNLNFYLIKHILSEFQSVRQLSARDCLFVGKHAFNQGYYDKAIDWFETALNHARNHDDDTVSVSEIIPFLEAAIKVVSFF